MDNEARKSLLEALKVHLDSGMSEYCGYELSSSEALIVIDLLRFSIPVMPTYDHRYTEMGCSCCGNMVGGWEERPNYCPNCGQKIDWTDYWGSAYDKAAGVWNGRDVKEAQDD